MADRTWTDATAVLRRKLQVAAMMNAGFTLNLEGTEALYGLLTEMAKKLDDAIEMNLAEPPDGA